MIRRQSPLLGYPHCWAIPTAGLSPLLGYPHCWAIPTAGQVLAIQTVQQWGLSPSLCSGFIPDQTRSDVSTFSSIQLDMNALGIHVTHYIRLIDTKNLANQANHPSLP